MSNKAVIIGNPPQEMLDQILELEGVTLINDGEYFNETEYVLQNLPLSLYDNFGVIAQLPKALRGYEIKPVRTEPKIGRNDKCTCGSGKKYKHCCLKPI